MTAIRMYLQFVKCDLNKGKILSCAVLYRGDISSSSAHAAISSFKTKKASRFVEWFPSTVQVNL